MSHHGDQAAEPAPADAGHPGLLAKLMAAVRPEFRSDRLSFDPRDPVFGGEPCRVPDCGRTSRVRRLCRWHYLQWRQDKPDMQEFIAAADPQWRRYALPKPCRAPGCRYGRRAGGLCSRHYSRWRRGGQPELESWLPGLRPAALPDPLVECLISHCDLWARSGMAFCQAHAAAWRRHGKPAPNEFARRYDDETLLNREIIDLRGLRPQLCLEMQYVFQRRRDDGQVKVCPGVAQRVVNFIAASSVGSLLDWPERAWEQHLPPKDRKSSTAHVLYARRQIEDLRHGRGWDIEYPRELWRLRNLDIHHPIAHLRFDRIPQPWLKELAKRWTRWRLATGLSAGLAATGVRAITRFAAFLASPAVNVAGIAEVDRALLERYLADLHTEFAGRKLHGERIGHLNAFLTAVRQHSWDDALPADARFYPEDHPKRGDRLPRALPEHIMSQIERPDSLALWDCPAQRLITLILIRCGLRLGDACRLPYDCVVCDAENAPYLRYHNHKMNREALVPIDEQLRGEIGEQQQRLRDRWPQGTPVLFPRLTKNVDGREPIGQSTYRLGLRRWLERCDVRDENGHPVRVTPHAWRHTLGTRLINRDVPQEVVRRILDHDSHAMTAHYARLHDTTIRRHWERAHKVNAHGETVTLDPDGPLAEAAWAKQRVGRATQALPNGYCGLPVQQSCPHANACLSCPMFLTTAEFLPQHRQHRQQTLQIITAAEARGQLRLAEMNRQVAGNLDKIITALENDPGEQDAADAC